MGEQLGGRYFPDIESMADDVRSDTSSVGGNNDRRLDLGYGFARDRICLFDWRLIKSPCELQIKTAKLCNIRASQNG